MSYIIHIFHFSWKAIHSLHCTNRSFWKKCMCSTLSFKTRSTSVVENETSTLIREAINISKEVGRAICSYLYPPFLLLAALCSVWPDKELSKGHKTLFSCGLGLGKNSGFTVTSWGASMFWDEVVLLSFNTIIMLVYGHIIGSLK